MDKQGITIDVLIENLNHCVHGDDCEKCIACEHIGERYCWGKLLRITIEVLEQLKQREKFHDFLWNTIQPNQMEVYISMFNAGMKGEKSDGNNQK